MDKSLIDYLKQIPDHYEEDISPQKAGFAPRNLSVLKTWVLTLLRTHGFDSIKSAISEISRNLGYVLTFCT